MTWLYEDASTILYGGIACVAVLTIVLLQVGRGVALLGLVISAALVGLLLLVERNVVTDKERVEETLWAAASALEANDVPALLQLLSESNPEMRRSAEGYMGFIRIERVRIGSDLKIVINELTSPASASVSFTGRLQFDTQRGDSPFKNDVAKYSLSFLREDQQWRIAGYQRDPLGGL
jgi:hypothetical protein